MRGKVKALLCDLCQVKDRWKELDGAYIAVDTNRAVDADQVFSFNAIRWRTDCCGTDGVVSVIKYRDASQMDRVRYAGNLRKRRGIELVQGYGGRPSASVVGR